MKKKYCSTGILVLFQIAISLIASGQKTISKENFQLLRTPARVSFTPFTKNDFVLNASGKTELDLVALPNGKKVSLGDYLKTVNYVEKNLSELGYSRDRKEKLILVSQFKSDIPDHIELPQTTKILLTRPALSSRFSTALIAIQPITASNIETLSRPKTPSRVNADLLPNDTINRNENFDIPKFSIAGYSVKIDASFNLHGVVDPFQVADRQLNVDSLNTLVTKTSNEYSMGYSVNIATTLPQIGNFSMYNIQSKFSSKANGSIKSTAKVKVMDQLIVDEDQTVSNNKYSFVKNSVLNTSKKLASADIFMYGLNFLSPVDFYLHSNAVGADFDVTMTKTNVHGTIEPIITQSIFMESSVTEMLGPGGEFINTDILDAGVGGELRLVEGGLDFGGSIGLTVEKGALVLKNDAYKSIDVALLRGRLYTYYSYPRYTCPNILGVLDPGCWSVVTVENNLFDSGNAVKYQKVLFDENKDKTLDW